jgi:hypothetical protein
MGVNELLNDFRKGKISRRDFFKIGGIVLFCEIITDPIKKGVNAIVESSINKIMDSNLVSVSYHNDLIKKIFGDFKKDFKFSPGSAHHLYSGFHPNDKIAAATLEKVGLHGIDKIQIVDKFFNPNKLRGNFVTLGGPVSNFLSRAILDYKHKSSDPKEGFIRNPNTFYDLPFAYLCDYEQLRKTGTYSDYGVGGIILDIENNKHIVPKKDGHKLKSDYLLISSLPNILSKSSYENEDKIIVFGGTHGVGTTAIDTLFRDIDALQNLYQKIHNVKYWQAIIEVDEIIQQTGDQRAKAFSIRKDIICKPVSLNYSTIEKRFKT